MIGMSLDRRAFLEGLGMAAALCALPVTVAAPRSAKATPQPQMALFLDYPYYDKWGTGAPYVPPTSWGTQAVVSQDDAGRFFSYV